MLRRAIPMMLVGVLTTTGCTVSFSGDGGAADSPRTAQATAPVDDDGVEVWDLRSRPTAQDVGMPKGKDYVAYETDESRTVRFLLPENKVLETELYLVVFDRITVPATTDKTVVTGVDFRAKTMPLDDAYVVMADSLKAFGLDTSAVDQWRAEIEGRPKSGPSADQRIKGGGNTELGYLGIGVGGVYNPINGDNTAVIKYRINFKD